MIPPKFSNSKVCEECREGIYFQGVDWDDDKHTSGWEIYHCRCRKYTYREPAVVISGRPGS